MIALEVKEDGQIWLIPDCPKEPNYSEYFEFSCASVRRDYQKVIASAERILVSDQMGAAEILIKAGALVSMEANKPLLNQGIYRIPDLKWEVKEQLGVDESCETWDMHECFCPYPCGKRKVAVIIQEDEKNGMYQSDNPIMSKLPTDANLYDLNEAYMGFLKWFYKDQFGYILDSHAIDAIFSDMKLYQQSKSL